MCGGFIKLFHAQEPLVHILQAKVKAIMSFVQRIMKTYAFVGKFAKKKVKIATVNADRLIALTEMESDVTKL